ncbi:hypothetical protein A2U01_0020356, partial [Trifolium medium]|nr:hypothetical protein [Trifolium medium]
AWSSGLQTAMADSRMSAIAKTKQHEILVTKVVIILKVVAVSNDDAIVESATTAPVERGSLAERIAVDTATAPWELKRHD